MIYLKETDVLLFQGDSITHGGRVYSDWDMNHIIGHGYQASLAARLGLENVERHPVIINRGVSGDTTAKLLARWNEDCLQLHPTVLSILIGANDAGTFTRTKMGPTPEFFGRSLRFLLDYTKEVFPDVKLILGEPFRFYHPKSLQDPEYYARETASIEIYRQNAQVVKEIAKDYGAVFVPYAAELEQYVTKHPVGHIVWDGVHPTYVGHEIMANLWYKTVDDSGILARP